MELTVLERMTDTIAECDVEIEQWRGLVDRATATREGAPTDQTIRDACMLLACAMSGFDAAQEVKQKLVEAMAAADEDEAEEWMSSNPFC